jgi:ABC-type transporter MlaC component
LTLVVPSAAEGREMPVAERFIQKLGERAIDVLNRTGVDETVRIRGIAQLLEEAVDLETVARIVLGRNWQRASDAQLRDYVGLFRAYMLGTLA